MAASVNTAASLLGACAATWSALVQQIVKKPYLDEVFHVPQAQHYCQGDFAHWDPKITTPPGLYLISTALSRLSGCDTNILRLESAECLVVLFVVLLFVSQSQDAAHRALNLALFPPLFFFSALYYTDVASTLSVMLFYHCQQHSIFSRFSPPVEVVCTYLLGLTTLLFRQTNIFWVAIYPAAVVLIQQLNKGHAVVQESMYKRSVGFGDSWSNVIKTSWKHRVIYNPDVGSAVLEDYIKCVLTIITTLLRALTDVDATLDLIMALIPFVALLGTFAAFIVWNGSVVLGDKSNHVTTLHLPQMLYLWPYILFFSWPTLLPQLLGLLASVPSYIPIVRNQPLVKQHSQQAKLPGLRYIALFSILAFLAIHYNTIVHPFTLADNRHYTFYVFRLLMRPWWMRYAVIPVYAISAWVCIQACGSSQITSKIPQRAGQGASTSLVLIWLGTSALQLITAPLVEPRYFILPWMFWMLALPPTAETRAGSQRLWTQTAWLVLVNAGTGYMFLQRPFKWASEPGALQRFMW